MKKKKVIKINKIELEKRKRDQFELSIELGYFTREEVENHFKSKEKKEKQKILSKKNKKVKKPIIYYGFNTGTK
jgi:hypothetical protein